MIIMKCDQAGHLEYPVSALCSKSDCKYNSACCMRCMKLHPDCASHLKFIEDVPEVITQFKTLRTWFRDSFNQIKQHINNLEKMVSEHFLPIDGYTNSPTLNNLNKLGQMLKGGTLEEIQGFEQQKQKICQDLDDFKDMLSSRNVKQIKYIDKSVDKSENKSIDKSVNRSVDKELAEKYLILGKKLFNQLQLQAGIEFFNKALEIDKENIDSLYWKGKFQIFQGRSLLLLDQLQEANKCYDQCIKLDPRKHHAYHWKGNSLMFLDSTLKQLIYHKEAIKCYDEQIKLTPMHLKSYKYKGDALRELSCLKEEEQCYIEGLKHLPNNGDLKKWLSSVREEMIKKK